MSRACIFDLDGTLLDTFPGIMRSANDAARELGYRMVMDRSEFAPFTGLPLSVGFPTVFGMSGRDAEEAPRRFIELYEESGCLVYDYYPGMAEAVRRLSERGVLLGVSTLKTEGAARKMLASSLYSGLFLSVRGNTPADDAEKSSLIGSVLSDLGCAADDAVFIGDTAGDMAGAERAGVPFIGVSWGFGSTELMKKCMCAGDPAQMERTIAEMFGWD